jgi:hypothetical protein
MRLAFHLFPKCLGFCYLVAFLSFGLQASGLIGSRGILPFAAFLPAVRDAYGGAAFWNVPTLFWLNSSDLFLHTVWMGGVVASLLLMWGIARKALLVLLLLLYLSLCAVGQDFLSFQWDVLLLEAGFLAVFLDPSPARIWLFRWLLFRLMFLSGMVKLLSRDPVWRNLTALHYHYETQPLPTPLAWYLYQLPLGFQRASTFLVFIVELAVPFLIFAPRRLRMRGAALLILLQILILATGNYSFFNLLTIFLCLFLFDDAALGRILAPPSPLPAPPSAVHRRVSVVLACAYFSITALQVVETVFGGVPAPAAALLRIVEPLRMMNTYGLFAVMTTTRPEIVVEGSNDGQNWQAYEFRYKPGDVRRAPPLVAPHQPRLDWQMWFAALGSHQQNPWFSRFLLRLLEGSPPVLRLLARNPFPNAPPRYIRALLYEYRFTTPEERRASGAWWKRELRNTYFPAVSLRLKTPVTN